MKKFIPATSLIFLCFVSCKSTEKTLSGNYIDHYNFENNTKLELHSDYNFHFQIQAGLAFFKINGKWKIDNDTLVLFNTDTSNIAIEELKIQKFFVRGNRLFEIANNKRTGLKLKKEYGIY